MTTGLASNSMVAICRRAFSLAEAAAPLTDTLDGSNHEDVQARLFYDQRRSEVLEALDWSFARKRMVPAKLANPLLPASFAAGYQLPGDCVRLRGLSNGADDFRPYQVEGTVVFSDDLEAPQIVYTADIDNPALFKPSFTRALELLIAADAAMVFSRSANRQQTFLRDFERHIERASFIELSDEDDRPIFDHASGVETWATAGDYPRSQH